MQENQHTEWKALWRDDYLRWLCGFANAEGGLLEIGRNDAGVAVGVPDAARLLEDIPNKVRDVLGIMVDVNLVEEAGHALLQIRVNPYPNLISCRAAALKLAHEDHFRKAYLLPAMQGGWVSMTIPGKPTSRLQKYRLTAKGLLVQVALRSQPPNQ